MHASDPVEGGDNLSELFWTVARQLREVSMETLAQWDVTPSQARALRSLAHHGSMRLSELSKHLRIAAGSATEVIDTLESKELALRQPDPHDRRATLVALTDTGQARCDQIRAARGAESERVFDRLSTADRTELARLLRLLAD